MSGVFNNFCLGGDPLIHDDELPRFKEVLKQVMKVRNFEQLRKEVLPYVKEIRMKSCKKFVDSMFSKKFWSTFLNKEENRDIKNVWESLPSLNGKILPKKSAKKIDQDDDDEEEVEEENYSYTCESENEQFQCEEEFMKNEYVVPPERQTQGGFWVEDEKSDRKDTLTDDGMDQIDYGGLQSFFINTEEVSMPAEMAFRCSQDQQINTNERSKQEFLDDFWNDWQKRADGKGGFPLGLSQDSHKPAYFSKMSWE